MQTIWWLGLFIALLVIEAVTMGLTTIWFAGGALAAFILGTIGLPLWIQVGAFVVVSLVLLAITRPIAKKHLNNKVIHTNVDRLIGLKARVTEDIDTLRSCGQVEAAGQEWSAKTADPEGTIGKGTTVIVEAVQGVKLVVRKEEE